MIEVTAAIIHNEGKILICQRPRGKRCEMLWEFPGGKIEDGETSEECLIRECREELGITIVPEKMIQEVKYDYPDVSVNIRFYMCKFVDGEPTCLEHNDIQWLTLEEILNLPLCPADKKMLKLTEQEICEFIRHDHL
jgi:8-oxo-dGTP diphosphatase